MGVLADPDETPAAAPAIDAVAAAAAAAAEAADFARDGPCASPVSASSQSSSIVLHSLAAGVQALADNTV